MTTSVGVIIGRFQVPELHKGHKALFDEVLSRHKKVIVLLGVAPVKLTRSNPLDYFTRELMVKRAYPKAIVLPIKDAPNDKHWSKAVDDAIASVVNDEAATIYGSRDSFIPAYSGVHATVELPASEKTSGTAIREAASKEVRGEKAYRTGVIYAAYNRYPTSYQCVDAVIWRPLNNISKEILLARKHTDQAGLYRLIGGFVSPNDETLEDAAKREAFEETGGLALGEPQYIFSKRVHDWRYSRNDTDQILTAVFLMQYLFGAEEPSDDIDELSWFNPSEIDEKNLVPEHRTLWPRVLKALRNTV